MRGFLLSTVLATLEQCSDSEDPGASLSPGALAAATELLDAIAEPEDDLEVAHMVGWLHWYRFLALRPDGGEADFNLALRMLGPVCAASPDAVPTPVREFFEANGPSTVNDGPDQVPQEHALAEQGLSLLKIALRTGGLAELDGAIEPLRDALNIAPASHPGRAGWLTNLGLALRARFEHTGSSADLDAAVPAD